MCIEKKPFFLSPCVALPIVSKLLFALGIWACFPSTYWILVSYFYLVTPSEALLVVSCSNEISVRKGPTDILSH